MRTVRKISIALILLVGLLFTIQSCQTDIEEEPIPQQTTNDVSSHQLGKKLENPYSVKNMQKALNNLLGKNKGSTDTILPSHLYLKFIPLDELELDRLDSLRYISEYPLDYEIIEGESCYRDPEVPDDQPTFQYTSIKIGDEIPNVNYEIIEELYIPEEDSEFSNKSKISVDQLVNEALRITNNLSDIKDDTKGSWRPAGTIRVWDDVGRKDVYGNSLGKYIPLRGVKVEARRWFTVHTGITDANGNYTCDGTFSLDANYKIVWERAYYDIRDGVWGQAIYNGPKQNKNWNIDIGSETNENKSMRYAHIHRAAYRYYYDYVLDLDRPIISGGKMKISYFNRENNDLINGCIGLGLFEPTFSSIFGGGLVSQIRIFGKSCDGSWQKTDRVFSTTAHELTHAAHLIHMGNIQFWQVSDFISESWARACEIEISKYEYRIYLNNGNSYSNPRQEYFDSYVGWHLPCVDCSDDKNDAMKKYTPVFYDLIDTNNQYNSIYNNDVPYDNISGYTLSGIQDEVLYQSYGLVSLRDKLRNYRPTNITTENINNYLSFYFNNM